MIKVKRYKGEGQLSGFQYTAFAVGDLGYQMVYYWVVSFTMIYCTDVFGLSAGAVSVVMLIARLYDAVNNPILGSVIDRTRSKMGRYRPWILIGGIGLAVSTCLLFWPHTEWSAGAKNLYVGITYILVATFATIFYMAYMALNGCISSDPMTRAKASSYRTVLNNFGIFILAFLAPAALSWFGGNSSPNSYVYSILICLIVGLPCILLTALGTKEVVRPAQNQKKISMRSQIRALKSNKPMILIFVAMTTHGISMNARLAMATYYCTYYAGDFSTFTVYNSINSIMAMAGAFTAPYVYRFFRDKGKAARYIMYASAAAMAAQYFFPAPGVVFYGLTFISGYGLGAFSALIFSMIPDAADYTQYRHNLRIDGFLAAFATFGFEGGGALATTFVGFALEAGGYVANGVQAPAVLNLMNLLMTMGPAIMTLTAGLFLIRYDLNDKRHRELVEILESEESGQ